MKFLLSLFLIPLLYSHSNKPVSNAASNTKVLSWQKEQKLNWSDFKGMFDKQSEFAAECNWEIQYSYSYNENRQDKFQFEVFCYFNKEKSWVKPEHKSEELLHHEQVHFDIAELCSRKLRKNLVNAHFTKGGFKSQINEIFKSILQECDHLQKNYDEETNHGLNKERQKEWSNEVISSLATFENYAYNPSSSVESSPSLFSRLFKKLN